jgi:hypothetical protein
LHGEENGGRSHAVSTMSFDLYLLPRQTIRLDAELARAFVERENARFSEIPDSRDLDCERRKRGLADLLLRLKPNYREFEIDYGAIAQFEKISVSEAQRKYRYIEINDTANPREAQFTFHDQHVAVRWFCGMSAEEMDAILRALSLMGDFVIYNPQTRKVSHRD